MVDNIVDSYSYDFSKEIKSNNNSLIDAKLMEFKGSIKFLDDAFTHNILKITYPLSNKIFNKIPLVTIFNFCIINDILFNTIFSIYCFIVGDLMLYITFIYLFFSIFDIAFLSDFIKKKKSIYFVFLLKTCVLLIIQCIIYILSYLDSNKSNSLRNLSIIYIFINLVQNVVSSFIIWSAKKNKISLNEDEYIISDFNYENRNYSDSNVDNFSDNSSNKKIRYREVIINNHKVK